MASRFFDSHNEHDWDPGAADILSNMERYRDFMQDDMSQWLLDTAYFNSDIPRSDRGVARAWVEEYWLERWGYVFTDQFDWAAWRQIQTP